MRVWGALQGAALLASVLWATPLLAKKEHPTIEVTAFEQQPWNLNYFPESDVVLFQDKLESNVYRSDDGGVKWKQVDDVKDGVAWMLFMHEFDNERAYIVTQGTKHYRTHDRGKSWTIFETKSEPSLYRPDLLKFHADDPDRIIFNGLICQSIIECHEVAMYTTDGFKTPAKVLRPDTDGCWWAKSSDLFSTGSKDLDRDRILCVSKAEFSSRVDDQRLLISDDFFKTSGSDIQEFEPNLDTNKPVHGVVNVAVVKKYLLVATTSSNTNEMALFVTDDTKKWHRAVFPTPHDSHDHRLMQEAYTVLESTNYSIQIDVMTTHPSKPMGVLLTSNSNGTYFIENTEHTNRNTHGHVDFEKIAGIQGIFLINKVENWKDVEKDPKTDKKIVTEITFDDGRTFEKVTADGKRIHLHSVTELSNLGRVFSSPAPGLVMGIGNTGDYLDKYKDGSLYVSDDAGMTWSKALDGPHKYEFGDQGSILVAIKDSEKEDIDEFSYSLDHGVNWVTEDLPKDLKIQPYILTTTTDSTSLKFILIGESKDKKKPWKVISIDFEGLHEDTCKDSDMEEWHARVDKDGKPTCLMGHTQSFRRRKKTAKCFLKQEFKHIEMETKDCDCTDLDFECDYNFVRDDDGKCVKRGPIIAPEGACPAGKPDATFKGTSGYRKIPGNTCKPTKETDEKYKEKEQKCSDVVDAPSAPATGLITQTKKSFGKWNLFEKHYLPRGESSSSNDETIIMRPANKDSNKIGSIWISKDHGKKWEEIDALKDENVLEIIPHDYFKDMVFFVLKGKKVMYTLDRGERFHEFEVHVEKDPEDRDWPLKFHPDKMNWLLWEGRKCDGDECYKVVTYSEDRGDNWKTGARYIERCEFTGSSEYKYRDRKQEQILCVKHEKENNEKDTPWVLSATDNWFKDEKIREKNVRNFATMSEFIVVATEDKKEKTLHALASLDGVNYAEAKFPFGFDVPHQHGYTVLESSTHAVNLFVATEVTDGGECVRGTIIKSNSNGTSYVVSARNINCDGKFYVDFEKMQGLQGVVLVNTIANPGQEGAPKKLQTKISHNDGAEWDLLPSPAKDDEFGKFPCHSSAKDKCALHLHGYTERRDRSKTYSTETAIGILLGWGNVGDSLAPTSDADTFLSIDAGITWRRIKKGKWTWAIGDQGSILVLVEANKETDVLFYSLDLGESWKEHKFSEDGKVEVWDITTQQSGNSQNFLIWGSDDNGMFTINLDFSGFTERVCKHSEDASKSDYTIFTPQHPKQPNGCLFGHKSEYLRKKPGQKCVNDFNLPKLYTNTNCTCTRQDFECDYNFELDNHGQCKLVAGHAPLDAESWCAAHPDTVEYFEPTGYRRVPLTTCVDGKQLDKVGEPVACKNHEEEFERKHRTSGVAIFFAVIIPFAAAGVVGWYVYRNWNGKFGQIRLGEQGSSAFDSDQPWVKYPVIVLSAVVAVIGALPVVAGSLWRAGKGLAERWGIKGDSRGGWSRLSGGGRTARYTTRDSFARGRGDYAAVDDDEGELLGEDSDEEV